MALSTAHRSGPDDGFDESFFSASAVVRHEARSAEVTLAGDLCRGTAWRLVALLDGLVADGVESIDIDVSSLRICTSHGVDAIEATRAHLAVVGGTLSVRNARGVVRKVLEVVGMPVADTSS